MSEPILQVRDLHVEYATPSGPARAVSGVTFDLDKGEFLAIVGESGCGKSTLLYAVAQLLTYPGRIASGDVLFDGVDFTTLKPEELRTHRWRDFSVVMQSAMNALNPTLTIESQLADACKAHTQWSDRRIAERSAEVLAMVAIDAVHLKSYPFQLSGGMRQRAMIAMALLLEPKLVIMDEPTSALDVVAQRSLMHQVQSLRHQLGFAVIFVTHDMSVVSHYSDRLAVMYAGEFVELGPTREVFDRPEHPYSQGLMEAFPSLLGESKQLTGIAGTPPSLVNPPEGCLFAPRCSFAFDECRLVHPELIAYGDLQVRCHLVAQKRKHDA
ncbi:MAG TPA: ABC transporter ATP-binding protein [Acidimicrobiales bacterium]|nr:ABC transporter ATP-binding protein [Acidimicrobiales bacterium]